MPEEIKIPRKRPERVAKVLDEVEAAVKDMDAETAVKKKFAAIRKHERKVKKAKGMGLPIPKTPKKRVPKERKRYKGGNCRDGKGTRLCIYMDAGLHKRLVDACEPRKLFVSGAIQAAVKLWLKLPKDEAKATALACQKRLRIA